MLLVSTGIIFQILLLPSIQNIPVGGVTGLVVVPTRKFIFFRHDSLVKDCHACMIAEVVIASCYSAGGFTNLLIFNCTGGGQTVGIPGRKIRYLVTIWPLELDV